MPAPRLEVRGASKTFAETKVLDDVSLLIEPGEVHALIGQNGSGKSTLIKTLTGYHAPDPGMTLTVDGHTLAVPVHWASARAAGLSVVHQDLGLIDHQTVSDNICIGGFPRNPVTRRINKARQRQAASDALARIGLPLDPGVPVSTLPAAHRTGVAIARALRDVVPDRGIIILDEATRSLSGDQLDQFHDLMRRIVAAGTSILMVSHNLQEVLALSNRITVLRDGRVVGAGVAAADVDEADLAKLMLGKTVESIHRRSISTSSGEVAKMTDVRLGTLDPIEIVVREGEVVGLTGLPGSGFENLPAALGGGGVALSGTVRTPRGERDLTRPGVRRAMALGIAVLPEQRLVEGLSGDLSIRDNLALPSLRRRGRAWFVSAAWQNALAAESIRRFSVRANGIHHVIRELSGGNQQKVLFAKWLSVSPQLMVLHEPTQGVDVGAREDLMNAIRDAADNGTGVLLVSTEPTDLVQVCDRIQVVRPGLPVRELRTDDVDDVIDAVYSTPMSSSTKEEATRA